MYTIRGTKKFLDRVGPTVTEPPDHTTVLGDWYANVLLWRPQVALFVNATTFLPVLMPLAPAKGVGTRFAASMAVVMNRFGIDPRFVDAEVNEMTSTALAKTASRQVLGVMTEFAFMAEHTIKTGRSDPNDLLGLSCWLADTIVGPLAKVDHYSPVGALRRVVASALPDA